MRCPAVGCSLEIPPSMLMCRFHWSRVPHPIKTEVWRGYKSKDAVGHAQACVDAVAAVASIEGKDVPLDHFWTTRLEQLQKRQAIREAERNIETNRFTPDREDD